MAKFRPLLLAVLASAIGGQALAGSAAQEATPVARVGRVGRRGRRLLAEVNRRVNDEYVALIPWPADKVDGIWDCENYAYEKRDRLVAAGVARENLKIWRAVTPWGEAHAVLIVDTDDGPLALDNLQRQPTPWQALKYSGWAPMWITRNPPAHP